MADTEQARAHDRGETDPKLMEMLVCPLTKGPLRYDPSTRELISKKAGLAYAVIDGVPVMLPDEARVIDPSPDD
ncbi:MAG: Trm112 family protein [Hyphomicrobiales bacterium]|nr:Trm112 family protein [Hyphomicrobiales bacterium]